MSAAWPVIVLGGSGYVAGEMLRLVAQHPRLHLRSAVSSSQAGEPVAASFGHLAPLFPEERFVSLETAMTQLAETEHALVLSAAPHGASAQLIDQLLTFAESQGVTLTIVDASADFRFSDPSLYAATYGHEHRAPARLGAFRCSVPEHLASIDAPHAAHPGCFATAMLLAIVPLLRSDLSTGEFYVSAVTGSTGAGRSPRETTHHPVRQSTVFAYQPLVHRHAPEVRALAEATAGVAPKLHFVPHSGPFARGIHATVFAPTKTAVSEEDATELLREFYRGSQFVLIEREPPRLKDVVASNYARLSASTDEGGIVVCCVLDNLVKGAAGGSIQWANRLLGLPESEGLLTPAAGWT